MRYITKTLFFVVAGALLIAYSCTKPNNNNNNSGNNNNPPPNPSNPSVKIEYPAADTSVPITAPPLTIELIAMANDSGVALDSVVRTDGLSAKMVYPITGTKKTDTLYDYYTLPAAASGQTVSLVYTVWDKKGHKSTSTRKLMVSKKPPVFNLYSVTILDQATAGVPCMLNTGANPPTAYTEGQVTSDSGLRRLVDMVCASTAGQRDILYSPAFVNESTDKSFADSNIYNINSFWLLSQRQKTFFRLLDPGVTQAVTTKNYPNEAACKTAYDNATIKAPQLSVQQIFSPNDNYAFETSDGRYGAFTVVQIGGGVKMTMAIQTR